MEEVLMPSPRICGWGSEYPSYAASPSCVSSRTITTQRKFMLVLQVDSAQKLYAPPSVSGELHVSSSVGGQGGGTSCPCATLV